MISQTASIAAIQHTSGFEAVDNAGPWFDAIDGQKLGATLTQLCDLVFDIPYGCIDEVTGECGWASRRIYGVVNRGRYRGFAAPARA
jgi:hypothetical protein